METKEGRGGSRVLSALGYIPMLCFLPLFLKRDDEFAQLHGRQGLVLLVTWVVTWLVIWVVARIFGNILGHIPLIGLIFFGIGWFIERVVGWILYIVYLILMVVGIIEAGLGKHWRLPVLGAYAERIRL
jgi:uncharacterized membrane protein